MSLTTKPCHHPGTYRIAAAALAIATAVAGPMAAEVTEQPGYLDDRSDAVAVIRSLYNAIDRGEFLRAYGYWGDGATEVSYEEYRAGFEKTESVELLPGNATLEGGAGSLYYTLPVAIRATDRNGDTAVYAGCYDLRMVQPAMQEVPPFVPVHITGGDLRPAKGPLSSAVPETCPD